MRFVLVLAALLLGMIAPAINAQATQPMLRLADMPLHDPFIAAHEPTKTYA